MKRCVCLTAIGIVAPALCTHAAIIGGDAAMIPPPDTVGNNHQQFDQLLAFDEVQNFILTTDLVLDAITIPAGTMISSHYVIYDPPGSGNTINGTVEFDGDVVAVLTRRGEMKNTDALLGATGVDYRSPVGRGLEGVDSVTISGPNQVTFDLTAGQPGDYIRVITIVPGPGTTTLTALAACCAIRRRR